MSAPLRRIVEDCVENPRVSGLYNYERLECGHLIQQPQDIYGYTNAVRRRCRHCEAEAKK